jgi:hypothetical protein
VDAGSETNQREKNSLLEVAEGARHLPTL